MSQGMIRIDDPADIGRVMGHVRVMLGLGMRRFARQVANRTGRSEDTIRHQLWAWETGKNVPGMAAAAPFLAELGIGLAFVPLDEIGPESPLSATESAEQASGVDGEGLGDSNGSTGLQGGEA